MGQNAKRRANDANSTFSLEKFKEKSQKPWYIIFESYKFKKFSYITKVKVLREFHKSKQFTNLAEEELEYYPKDIIQRFYTIKNKKQMINYIMNLEGRKNLLVNKSLFKSSLQSNDFYSVSFNEEFSLKENFYKNI